jgi:hypothetical protein
VLAVVVEMLRVMLVSVVVATWILGPDIPDTAEIPAAPPQVVVKREPDDTPTQPVPKEDRVVLPLGPIESRDVPVEEEIMRGLLLPAVPTTESLARGVVVPIPTLPTTSILNTLILEEEATSNSGWLLEVPTTEK